jgi:hypothetical protein
VIIPIYWFHVKNDLQIKWEMRNRQILGRSIGVPQWMDKVNQPVVFESKLLWQNGAYNFPDSE